MHEMMQVDKINDRIKQRRYIDKFSREGGGVEGKKVI